MSISTTHHSFTLPSISSRKRQVSEHSILDIPLTPPSKRVRLPPFSLSPISTRMSSSSPSSSISTSISHITDTPFRSYPTLPPLQSSHRTRSTRSSLPLSPLSKTSSIGPSLSDSTPHLSPVNFPTMSAVFRFPTADDQLLGGSHDSPLLGRSPANSAHRDLTSRESSLAPTNPIPTSDIPEANRFIMYSQQLYARKNNEQNDVEVVLGNETQYVMPRPSPLQYADRGDYFNTTMEHGNESEAIRHMAASLYVRYHHLSENDVARYLIASRYRGKSALKELWRLKISRYPSQFQYHIMSIYLNGLRDTIDVMGGRDLWLASTIDQRMDVYEAIWRQNPLRVAKAVLGFCARAVPIDDIFSDRTIDHLKWQIFHKTIFLWTCEDVWSFRIASDEDHRYLCFDAWQSMTSDDRIMAMDLGGLEDIPVKWGSVYDYGRRQLPRVVTRVAGYRIPTAD